MEDFEFCENLQVELHAVFRPERQSLFSPIASNDLEMGEEGSSENTIVLKEEEDKGNSPPTTPVTDCPTKTPRLPRGHPSGRRI